MTTDAPEWIKELREVVAANAKRFLSKAEFELSVRNLVDHPSSPLDAVRFHFSCPDNLAEFEVTAGDLAANQEDLNTIICHLPGEVQSDCKISTHSRTNVAGFNDHPTETFEELRLLADSYWKGQLRDDKSRLPALQGGHAVDLAETTMHHALETHGSVACLFCDLDNFKQVNDRINMAKGDDVIRQVAGILHSIADSAAIALHRSGDEFIFVQPTGDQNDALDLGMQVVHRISKHDFGTGDVAVGASAGIAFVTSEQSDLTYTALEQLAEKAVKLPDGTKLRGKATLRSTDDKTAFTAISADTINRAICLVKGDPGNRAPFESPFLNVLSRRVTSIASQRAFDWALIASDLIALVSNLSPTYEPAILRTSDQAAAVWDGRHIASPLDIALATANGLFVAGLLAGKEHVEQKKLAVYYEAGEEPKMRLALEPGNHALLELPFRGESFNAIELGGFHYFNIADDINPHAAQRALLVKIGHSALGIPETLFAEVLVVDDRPTRGGELRDFWESVIARLIATVGRNPNVEKVYVFGDERYARETVSRLRALDTWATESEYISYKTGANPSEIATVANRLNGRIEFVASESELYQSFANDLKDEAFLPPLLPISTFAVHHRFLRRQLELGDVALTRLDGCRVPTIAKAFPIVVEIARTAQENELIRDQAGQSLYELIDFKVHLTNPLQDRIPAFYQREQLSLSAYLDRAFLNADALFGSKIAEGRQLDTVLNHVATAIKDPRKQFATRRAILVLPNSMTSALELSPLGLVSIRIIPRFDRQNAVLHYSFTWRTVEALVGFPYSIFGSVGYAEHLTNSIREIVGGTSMRNVEMGEVSYIAHSLHIFRDAYGQHIARRIVDDASL